MPKASSSFLSDRAAPPAEAAPCEFVAGEDGRIETRSMLPEFAPASLPVLYFLVGWWGAATDYLPAMRHFSALGFPCRSFSWRGTGRSPGGNFFGRGYEQDFIDVLRHFRDERVVAIAHSGALDYLVKALPKLQASGGHRIEAAVVIAPLARSGSINALRRWLRFGDWDTFATRWIRFLGSNVFGVAWFMRNELALRRVLLADHVSIEDVRRVWSQIDACPYGRYFMSLCRYPEFLRYRKVPFQRLGVPHTVLLRPEHDRNFTRVQQLDTADAIGAEFQDLPNTCHQWFADAVSFRVTARAALSWLADKRLVPNTLAYESDSPGDASGRGLGFC